MVSESLPLISPMIQHSLVGVDPIKQIVMMENHDDAYHAWKKAGFRDRIVIHVDAHIDFGWFPEKDPEELLELQSLKELEEQLARPSLWNFSGRSQGELIQIGNYLNPALREGIVGGFYWVVPDGFLRTPGQRKLLDKMLDTLQKTCPRALEKITWADRSVRAECYGKPMVVCTLSDLPEFEESILLDIDTDFQVISSIFPSYPYADLPKTTPWIWPQELVTRLRERRLRTDFVTIAYSVEGGFTPLGYKYLGDELATLLRNPSLAMDHRQIMALKRQAALYQEEKKLPEAIQACEGVLAANSEDAAIYYQLAQLYYQQGRVDQAREHYQQAIALDPGYRTAYNTFGPVYFSLGRFAQSEAEYRKALTFDSEDVDALCGLADLCLQQRHRNEAIVHFQRASELRPEAGRAHLGLGRVYAKLLNWNAAEEELKQALISEKYEGAAQYWLGYVYSKRRRWDNALAAYKAASRLGFGGIPIGLSLGRLYLRKGNFYKAFRHCEKVIRLLPAVLLFAVRRLLSRIIRILSKRRRDGQPG